MHIFKLFLTDLKTGNEDCSTLISKKVTIFSPKYKFEGFPLTCDISIYFSYSYREKYNLMRQIDKSV